MFGNVLAKMWHYFLRGKEISKKNMYTARRRAKKAGHSWSVRWPERHLREATGGAQKNETKSRTKKDTQPEGGIIRLWGDQSELPLTAILV